jgi:enoyl-CoA hydratase/carnithine racemase
MSQPPSLQNVAIDVKDQAIAIVKYNRPQKGNSLNVPFLKVCPESSRAVYTDPAQSQCPVVTRCGDSDEMAQQRLNTKM